MALMWHISDKVENTAAESLAIRCSAISTTLVGPILPEDAWICREKQTHASVECIMGIDKHKAYAASIITHLTVASFTCQFNNKFPQKCASFLRLLLCAAKYFMLKMLHTKRSPQDCLLPPCGKTPPPGINGRRSAYGFLSHKILRKSRT